MEIRITENKYGKCDKDTTLVYPGVDTCLTVTALFGDGSRTGAHLTGGDAAGKDASWQDVFQLWKEKTGEKQGKEKHKGITAIFILGDLAWPEEVMREIRAAASAFGITAREETMHGDISVDSTGNVVCAK